MHWNLYFKIKPFKLCKWNYSKYKSPTEAEAPKELQKIAKAGCPSMLQTYWKQHTHFSREENPGTSLYPVAKSSCSAEPHLHPFIPRSCDFAPGQDAFSFFSDCLMCKLHADITFLHITLGILKPVTILKDLYCCRFSPDCWDKDFYCFFYMRLFFSCRTKFSPHLLLH